MTFSQSVFKHTCIFLTYIYTFIFYLIHFNKLVVTFVFLTGWHNSNGSYSFDGKKLNAKKNVNLNFIFASTANVKPLTANRGLRLSVNKINVNLKVSIMSMGKRVTRIIKKRGERLKYSLMAFENAYRH
jgi:hypothetical protein